MSSFVRHKLVGDAQAWESNAAYRKIRNEHRQELQDKLAACETPGHQERVRNQEHRKYLILMQDEEEAAYYERKKLIENLESEQRAAQAIKQAEMERADNEQIAKENALNESIENERLIKENNLKERFETISNQAKGMEMKSSVDLPGVHAQLSAIRTDNGFHVKYGKRAEDINSAYPGKYKAIQKDDTGFYNCWCLTLIMAFFDARYNPAGVLLNQDSFYDFISKCEEALVLNKKMFNNGISEEVSAQVIDGTDPLFEVTSQNIKFVSQSSTGYTIGSTYNRNQFIDFLNILETIPDKAHKMIEYMRSVSRVTEEQAGDNHQQQIKQLHSD